MSAAYYIVLDQEDPGFDSFVNGKALARASEELEALTQALGISTFEDWFGDPESDYVGDGGDYDESDDDDDFGMEESEDRPISGTWFEPVEGINWLQTLIAHLEEEEAAVENQENITDELNEFLEVLEQAEASGARWHLQIDG
ncbi:hypothetical protein [Acanthopleuribacter pedis]|uniref:Uncharacterized protein n=1 Tax=Acanthopleuribacter pedis TaxID=442870 RepID=A0A8J7QDK9_9BACT|nr:hypothetical protein [Acanthopleuribacter pedis]MBO1317123.1 hypothetical protein [Acanthopleuribacter pedis]